MDREIEKDTNSSREVGGEIMIHQRKKNRQAEKQWQRESRHDERQIAKRKREMKRKTSE